MFLNAQDSSAFRPGKRVIRDRPEYKQWDYLNTFQGDVSYHAKPDLRTTRFHEGFYRKPQNLIAQDADRISQERQREQIKSDQSRKKLETFSQWRQTHDFNILNGEGKGREHEFKPIGKKRFDNEVAERHQRAEESIRMRSSDLRFYMPSSTVSSDRRRQTIVSEGISPSVRRSAVLGYGGGSAGAGSKATGLPSLGTKDNFAFNHGYN